MKENTVLPLMNTAFIPGKAQETVNNFKDLDVKNIAQAELFYFQGEAKKCSDISGMYLMSPKIELKLSACMLYAYANLTLGDVSASKRGLGEIKDYALKELQLSSSKENKAFCVFASYLGSVLLHLPTNDLPDLKKYIRDLPYGIRLYATYIMAHVSYLNGDYSKALGMCESALYFCNETYTISMLYLYCMIAMCKINLKENKEAEEALMIAWTNAKPDGFLEPFIEHHGLLQGLIESCIKKDDPKMYEKLSEAVISFSRGWMSVHNPSTDIKVTDTLTTMEFSIAMLASRGWTNLEISNQLGMSVNTVKHYMSTILTKVGVKKREDLKEHLLK